MTTRSRSLAGFLDYLGDVCDQSVLEATTEANRRERIKANRLLVTAVSKFLCEPTDSLLAQVTERLHSVQASRKA